MRKVLRVLPIAFVLVLAFVSCDMNTVLGTDGGASSGPSRAVIEPTFEGPVPAGVAISSAVVWVYANFAGENPFAPNTVVTAHRVTAPWDELTTTWNSFGGSYDPAVVGSVAIGTDPGWYSIDITSLVQGWANEEYANYGVLLRIDGYGYVSYISSEHHEVTLRPIVEVHFGSEVAVFTRGDTNNLYDTTIFESAPDLALGNDSFLLTRGNYELEKQTLIQFDITFEEQHGYTRTIGYWKTHAGLGPGNQADMVSALLPIWLGTPGGAKSILVDSNVLAVDLLSRTVGGGKNGIAKLYSQLLGAKLNIANGASSSPVADVIADADAFLADHNVYDWDALPKAVKNQVIQWQSALDDYNNSMDI